jgi:glycosyltransferase involved in cell wall biosynthesis
VPSVRIAFANQSGLEFRVETAYEAPLGGSESALCYLTESLAQHGHEVFLLNACHEPAVSRGVQCMYSEPRTVMMLDPLDAFVIQNSAGWANVVRPLLARKTRLVLWTGLGDYEPAMQALAHPLERSAYDGFAFVSNWQRSNYEKRFSLDHERGAILGNAIAPAFTNLFRDHKMLASDKSSPPLLAYTSVPSRGLEVLLDVLPEIRRAIPAAKLKVFSSLRIYHVEDAVDEAVFGSIYRRCRETDGVEYIGAVPQPELAEELRSVALLAYPNTVAETFCIAALEAMAAGCSVVTSDQGAMAETTAGFARLIPIRDSADADYRRDFLAAVIQFLEQFTGPDTAEFESLLQRQVRYVNESCTWPVRAKQWVHWLAGIGPRTA